MFRIMRATIMFLLFATPFIAHSQAVGDWRVDRGTEMQVANTMNESKAITGVVCFTQSKSCNGYVIFPFSCEIGGRYPMMINSATGSLQITTTCVDLGGTKVNIIEEFEALKTAFESGGEIGFAVPMGNGRFNVVRFSTIGAVPAIKAAMTFQSSTTGKGKIESL